MNEVKCVFNAMYYDSSYMEEPKLVETFDDEQTACNFVHWRYESEFYYVEKEVS